MPNVLINDPISAPEIYDILIVAGVVSPGVFELEKDSGSRHYKWDVKDTAGAQGATITYRGIRPSKKIKGKFQFWNPTQIHQFYNSFVPLLAYDATKTDPKPVDVLHPILAANDITSVVTTEIGPLEHQGKQLWSVYVEFLEYRPAVKKDVTSTPTSTKNSTNKPTVLTIREQKIQELLEQAKKPL